MLSGIDRVSTTLEGVVHAAMPAIAYERLPFHEVDDARWDAVWEQTMRDAISVLQGGYRAMRDGGGAFVFITPVVGMSGAAELGPYSAAVEGVRLLAKSAARQWGPDGIRVNCLAPAPEHVPIGVGSGAARVVTARVGWPGRHRGRPRSDRRVAAERRRALRDWRDALRRRRRLDGTVSAAS